MRCFNITLALALSVGLVLLTGCNDPAGLETRTVSQERVAPHQEPPEHPGIQGLNATRHTTERYKDLSEARNDGYTLFSPFVPSMGFHYLHESAINEDGSSNLDRRLNRTDPEILVYSDLTEGNSGQFAPHDEAFAAVEYAIPKLEDEDSPPQHARALFRNAGAEAWHVHPNHHELGLSHDWTVHGECHYESGAGVLLAENPSGDFVLLTPTPPTDDAVGTWNGNVEPDQCPPEGAFGTSLVLVHGKWWTLHAWIWADNLEGAFHPTNPQVTP